MAVAVLVPYNGDAFIGDKAFALVYMEHILAEPRPHHAAGEGMAVSGLVIAQILDLLSEVDVALAVDIAGA